MNVSLSGVEDDRSGVQRAMLSGGVWGGAPRLFPVLAAVTWIIC